MRLGKEDYRDMKERQLWQNKRKWGKLQSLARDTDNVMEYKNVIDKGEFQRQSQ